MHVGVRADLHQFEDAVVQDVLIIQNQPAKKQTWRKNNSIWHLVNFM